MSAFGYVFLWLLAIAIGTTIICVVVEVLNDLLWQAYESLCHRWWCWRHRGGDK